MRLAEKIRDYYQHYLAKNAGWLSDAERNGSPVDATLKIVVRSGGFVYFYIMFISIAVFWQLTSIEMAWGWRNTTNIGVLVICIISVSLLMVRWFPLRKQLEGSSTALILTLAVLGGVLGGGLGRLAQTGFSHIQWSDFDILSWPTILGIASGFGYFGLLTAAAHFRRQQLKRQNDELAASVQKERLARQLTDAKLRLLQAQVEPHFLFNTLASVQQLAESRSPEAAKLTSQLIAFLRSGLANLRGENSTMESEFRMIEAYLAIMKTRMGSRLSYSLVLPDELKRQAIPPAMLISLVENAIKHGLEMHPPGGTIHVSAFEDNGKLALSVADTGRGMIANAASTGGLGLENIRERIAAIYGFGAILTTAKNNPNGFVATLRLPMLSSETIKFDEQDIAVAHVNVELVSKK